MTKYDFSKNIKSHILNIILLLCFTLFSCTLFSQVQLRDSVVVWQHHEFDLKADHSIDSYSTVDSDIEEVVFTNAKVIENELIKLVLLPEYGGRVLSFYYKPTGHEYLYQSECGSPYGIGDGNFYYNWLMVYGGIFPTFPEPEHGKTWLLPWEYSVIHNTSEKVTVLMEYTDDSAYTQAPWSFNNGVTNLTCKVEVSVYKNSSIWDFDVKIINDQGVDVNYEYWTCTTLAPGSEVGETGTPLNSEIIIPVEEYFAGWSPNSWIGNNNNLYDLADINYLSEWDNMGIAYADDFDGIYWGVINHENEEGIFRVSENLETKGVKLWTWGQGNIDNDLFDFSNGGADNYIELWAGVSESFFTDAKITSNEEKSWKESYCTTTNMSSICNMNNYAAMNLIWNEEDSKLVYELNTFHADKLYAMDLHIEGNNIVEEILNQDIEFAALGHSGTSLLDNLDLITGEYTVYFDLLDGMNNIVLSTSKVIFVNSVTSSSELKDTDRNELTVKSFGNRIIRAEMSNSDTYNCQVFSLNGRLLSSKYFSGTMIDIQFPTTGLFILTIHTGNKMYTEKLSVY